MKIEKNRRIPGKYPFKDMQVGDSFVIPADIKRHTVNVAALRFGRKHGMKFTVRKIPEGGYACWRIA